MWRPCTDPTTFLLQPHSLWYTSRNAPSSVPHHLLNPHDPTSSSTAAALALAHGQGAANHHHHHHDGHTHHPHPRDRDQRRILVERTTLARLRHDEQVMERRRANVANYGSAWLRPPGVPKTLFQLREERRELEEQAEAHRREALLQAQLVEAEGGGGGGGGDMGMGMDMIIAGDEDDEPMGEDEQEQQDLDDDIPEGEGFGFDGEDSDEEEDDDEDEETLSASDGSRGEENTGAVLVSPVEEEQVRDIRAAEDRVREMMAREQDGISEIGDAFADAFADEESREDLLEEEDLVPMQQHPAGGAPAASAADVSMGMDMDMDMDANLDEGIPEDEDDMYEHTDSDEDLSDEATRELSFAGRSSIGAGHASGGSRLRRSAHGSVRRASLRGRDRGSLAQSDMDISGLLSNADSSFLGNSPYMRRGV